MDAALVVLDGWGLAPPDQPGRDAVGDAATPVVDGLLETGVSGRLRTDGPTVGLPEGQMGNSEVGHLTMGAGRPVEQAYTRVERAVAEGTLADRPAIADATAHVRRTGGRLHLVGLVSDGGVHADHTHLHALVRAAAARGVPATTHAVTDGRDTPPTSGERFVATLERVAARAGTGAVATVTGRYHAMDRDGNWDRTRAAYDAVVAREARHAAATAVEAVRAGYDRGETDEFLTPTVVADRPGVADGDAVVVTNFRADRVRQLTRMLAGRRPEDPAAAAVWPAPETAPTPHVATMTEYDETLDLPVAFPPRTPTDTLGEVVAEAGLTQLRVAESEKYPHVTYFLDGGREVEFAGERREIVASPDVPTYDEAPAMSAPAVTDRVLERLPAEAATTDGDADPDPDPDRGPDLLVLNYANADMVGHTGDYEAAVAACEAVDREVGRLVPALRAAGADVLLTADHGNADDMGTPEAPHTAHTFNPVPVAYVPAAADGEGGRLGEPGTLADVAPTLLAALGLDRPDAMEGRPLRE